MKFILHEETSLGSSSVDQLLCKRLIRKQQERVLKAGMHRCIHTHTHTRAVERNSLMATFGLIDMLSAFSHPPICLAISNPTSTAQDFHFNFIFVRMLGRGAEGRNGEGGMEGRGGEERRAEQERRKGEGRGEERGGGRGEGRRGGE